MRGGGAVVGLRVRQGAGLYGRVRNQNITFMKARNRFTWWFPCPGS